MTTHELAIRQDTALSFDLPTPAAVEKHLRDIRAFQALCQTQLVKGHDWGVIPGTGNRPTLLKPGAEKIAKLLGLSDRYEVVNEVRDWDKGFFAFTIRCTLATIVGESVVSTGLGECNSMESKYRWRWVYEKDLPADVNKLTAIKRKNGQFRLPNDDIYSQVNCVTPETRILTRDLRWISAGSLQTGDKLIAVGEEPSSRYKRALKEAEAIVYGRKEDDLYQVTLVDGRKVRCNGEHKWLVQKVGLKGTEWASTQSIFDEIEGRLGRPRHWAIRSLCFPWIEEVSQESGYMAGLFDADGCLGVSRDRYAQTVVAFAQQGNGVLTRMKEALDARSFSFGLVRVENSRAKQPVYDLRIHGGITENMRVLGTIRPPRLLDKWQTGVSLEGRRFEGKAVAIEKVEYVGKGQIVLLGSTAGTYIAEGLVAHNTLLKMAKKRALVDAALSAGRLSDVFTQDLEDMPEGTVTDGETDAPPPEDAPLGLCPVHKTPFVSSPGKDGKPWVRCPKKVGDGWCKEKPHPQAVKTRVVDGSFVDQDTGEIVPPKVVEGKLAGTNLDITVGQAPAVEQSQDAIVEEAGRRPISKTMLDRINTLVDRTKTDVAKVKSAFKVGNLADLTAEQAAQAVKTLEAKLPKQAPTQGEIGDLFPE